MDHNFLEILETHIESTSKFLRKEISWILSNIMASNPPIIQRLIEHNIFNKMREKSLHDEIIVLFFLKKNFLKQKIRFERSF